MKLTAHDRCDRCNAAAMFRVANLTKLTDLMFCGHHYNRYRPALEAQGFVDATEHEEASVTQGEMESV